MKELYYLLPTLLLNTIVLSQSWNTYIANYDNDKPGSVTLRMDLINEAPLVDFNYLLTITMNYETNREDGFPNKEAMDSLYDIGEVLTKLIEKEGVFAGTFMFQKERIHYYYLKDTNSIKESTYELLNSYFKTSNRFNVQVDLDKEWSIYKDFLYPNAEILEYMSDRSVVDQLLRSGDDLKTDRRVDHWMYFNKKEDAENCIKELKILKFKEITVDKTETEEFVVRFWRKDFVDIDSIYNVTYGLRVMAKKYNGDYDGWETFVITD